MTSIQAAIFSCKISLFSFSVSEVQCLQQIHIDELYGAQEDKFTREREEEKKR